MQIAVLIFDGVTALEAVAPYEVLCRLPGARVTFVSERVRPVRAGTGRLALTADAILAEVPLPDLVVVPGGVGSLRHLGNGVVHQWLRRAALEAQWVLGVGAGTSILASAGLLRERRAACRVRTSAQDLERHGAVPIESAYVIDGRYGTAVDAAGAFDLALDIVHDMAGASARRRITQQLAGRDIQRRHGHARSGNRAHPAERDLAISPAPPGAAPSDH